jgi:hypothetical protein
MKLRFLIAFACLSFFVMAGQAQTTNCSYGTYAFSGGQYNAPSCTHGTDLNVSDSNTYHEWCVNSITGAQYGLIGNASGNSTITGYGEWSCWNGGVVCNPYMVLDVVNGGAVDPQTGLPSDYYANRFYNRAYDVTVSYPQCPFTGGYHVDFQQCNTQLCPPPPSGTGNQCCKCGGATKGEQLYRGFSILKITTCPSGSDPSCCGPSPIIIDTSGSGFDLTSAAGGVKFDIRGNGQLVQMGWTAPGSQNAFLCLPGATNACDDGKHLFGNFTPQPPSEVPNGFAALAVYDDNHDGVIDSQDAIFSQLRLWIDANHDGISQPNEIFTLPALGVNAISLNYKYDQRTDQYGNVFRYRAQVNPGGAPGVARMAYDVFFVAQPSSTTTTAQVCPARPDLLPQTKDGRLR